jgi:uncharacterized protein (DUF2147 family)
LRDLPIANLKFREGNAARRVVSVALACTLVVVEAILGRSAWAAPPALDGRWITFDGSSRKKRAVIEIVRDGPKVKGRIVELYLEPGDDPNPNCEKCEGANHGRPVLGLTILALQVNGDGRTFRGSVLDPEEGFTYQCVATLLEDGKRLRIRGFVGVELFGRTEIWVRAE